jgi:hypothetical protein
MAKQTKAEKEIDRRIERAYYETCKGIQISVLDINKVFVEGRKAIAAGADDEALRRAVRAFVETIKHN